MSTTEDEEPPEEKKYCCGNSAQNETGYVSKCDIAIMVNGLVAYTLVTVLLFVDPTILQSYVDNNPILKDLNVLIKTKQLYQIGFLAVSLIWLIFELCLSIYLLKASTLRNKHMLRNWFNVTLVTVIIGITTASAAIYYLQEKVYIGVGALVYYLYKWYGLWICTELIKEIKQGINPYAINCDFGTSF